MYGLRTRYLASIFVDADDIIPTKHIISDLMNKFIDEDFIPSSHEEITPLGRKQRIGFRSTGGSKLLQLNSQRFDFARIPTALDGDELGDFGSFCKEALSKLAIAINYFGRKSTRLAAVQEGFLQEAQPEQTQNAVNRLMKLPAFYSNSFIFEWDWRVASLVTRQVGGLTENTNNITTIRRSTGHLLIVPGEKHLKQIDGIRVDFDINTNPANSDPRFGEEHIRSFFEQAPVWHQELSSEVFSFMLDR